MTLSETQQDRERKRTYYALTSETDQRSRTGQEMLICWATEDVVGNGGKSY